MSKLVNLGCDALWGASNVDFPFLSTCRDDDHLLEKWTMSANFAANLLPGLTRERRVAGARWGVGRMNGRLGQYRYHRSSNRQWRRDAAAHAAGVATEDQWYEYDGLYQVGEFQRGTLSGSYPNFSGITPVAQNQDWNYDAMGNWLGFQNDALNQTRQFNNVNEITSINGPSGVVTPQYDPVGNMTSMPAVNNWTTAQTLKWDAWNRLVRVGEGSSTIAEYSYDALFRRLTKTVSGTTRRFYYSDQWQIIEEYVDSGTNPENRYWYGLREINDIARRQRYSSGTTLQDDLYALRETMNVVALVNSSGIVTQRMAYEAFGAVRFLTSAFAAGSNADGWDLLFHGHYRDADTGLYQMRFRSYHPIAGVWLSRDPIGEEGGVNLYEVAGNDAVSNMDVLGLAVYFSHVPESVQKCREFCEKACGDLKKAFKAFKYDKIKRLDHIEIIGPRTYREHNITYYTCSCLCMDEYYCSPGPFAKESIEAKRAVASTEQKLEIWALMIKHGCHHCGTQVGRNQTVADHQPPNALLPKPAARGKFSDPRHGQRLYPQCDKCRAVQGGTITGNRLHEEWFKRQPGQVYSATGAGDGRWEWWDNRGDSNR
jgi:RHS repeat-associated protein